MPEKAVSRSSGNGELNVMSLGSELSLCRSEDARVVDFQDFHHLRRWEKILFSKYFINFFDKHT